MCHYKNKIKRNVFHVGKMGDCSVENGFVVVILIILIRGTASNHLTGWKFVRQIQDFQKCKK